MTEIKQMTQMTQIVQNLQNVQNMQNAQKMQNLQNMALHEEIMDEFCHKMEDFILSEIDYSKENGYSGRARRFMKRKLNKQLEEFFTERTKRMKLTDSNNDSANVNDSDNDYANDSDSDSKMDPFDYDGSLMIKREECTNCVSLVYLLSVIWVYLTIGFFIYRYQSSPSPPL